MSSEAVHGIFLHAHGDASQTFLHVIHDDIKDDVVHKERQSYLSAMQDGVQNGVPRTIGAATHLYACPPLPNLKIETPREQLMISLCLETDKDAQQVDGDVSQTFLLVVLDQI